MEDGIYKSGGAHGTRLKHVDAAALRGDGQGDGDDGGGDEAGLEDADSDEDDLGDDQASGLVSHSLDPNGTGYSHMHRSAQKGEFEGV